MTFTPSANDMVSVLQTLVRSLEISQVPYCIGGSFASSIHGEFRATNDIDLLTIFSDDNLKRFIAHIQDEFSFEENALRQAIANKSTFNLIHLGSMIKVDLYPKAGLFEQEQIRRAVKVTIPNTEVTINVSAPEDILLAKLWWFQMGGRVSDRQWRDIEGIVRIQETHLNREHLEKWANILGVVDLLAQSLSKK